MNLDNQNTVGRKLKNFLQWESPSIAGSILSLWPMIFLTVLIYVSAFTSRVNAVEVIELQPVETSAHELSYELKGLSFSLSYSAKHEATKLAVLNEGHDVVFYDIAAFPGRCIYLREKGDLSDCRPVVIDRSFTGGEGFHILVQSMTGGQHCCFFVTEYSWDGQSFWQSDFVEGWHSVVSLLTSEDGKPYLYLRDWTFAYWLTSFAASPAPPVFLTRSSSGWKLDPDQMRWQEVANESAFAKGKSRSSEIFLIGGISPELWWEMVQLIYSGNGDAAIAFARGAWPVDRPGIDTFMRDFFLRLGESPYIKGLRTINNW